MHKIRLCFLKAVALTCLLEFETHLVHYFQTFWTSFFFYLWINVHKTSGRKRFKNDGRFITKVFHEFRLWSQIIQSLQNLFNSEFSSGWDLQTRLRSQSCSDLVIVLDVKSSGNKLANEFLNKLEENFTSFLSQPDLHEVIKCLKNCFFVSFWRNKNVY